VFDNQVLRGFLAVKDVNPPFIVPFQFNPSSISDNKGVSYADQRVLDVPGKVFTGSGSRTISFDIRLYGLEEGASPNIADPVDNGITVILAKLRALVYRKADVFEGTGGIGRRLSSPPHCYFGFGTRLLECIVTDLRVTETQFNPVLAPVRADVSITLSVVEDPQNPLYLADRKRQQKLAALPTLFGTTGGPVTKPPFGR
jgi:hypothetical protein